VKRNKAAYKGFPSKTNTRSKSQIQDKEDTRASSKPNHVVNKDILNKQEIKNYRGQSDKDMSRFTQEFESLLSLYRQTYLRGKEESNFANSSLFEDIKDLRLEREVSSA
jgi:hypothetical protein